MSWKPVAGGSQLGTRLSGADPDASQSASPWDAPRRASVSGRPSSEDGTPLAIELALVMPGADESTTPRLEARLMRPGARGGWVNGSLAWGALEPWNLRDTQYRPDHLDVARAFGTVQRLRARAVARPRHEPGAWGRGLDLSDWSSRELWPLLERADGVGMVVIHAAADLGPVPRHQRGELRLDVRTAESGGALIRPEVHLEDGPPSDGFTPRAFLGTAGHGLVLGAGSVERPAAGDSGTGDRRELFPGELRLVRLERETPPQLQAIVLDSSDLAVPADGVHRFATELAPALSRVAPVHSSDGSFSVSAVSAPTLLLRATHAAGHRLHAAWHWVYRVGDSDVEFAFHVGSDVPGIRDVEAEHALLDSLTLPAGALRRAGLLDTYGKPAGGTALLSGFETVDFLRDARTELGGRDDIRIELAGDLPDYRQVDATLEIGIGTRAVAGDRDWFDLDVTISVEGRVLPFATVFAALVRREHRMLLEDGAYFSLGAPELQSLRELIEEARGLGEGSSPGSLRISRYQAGLWRDLVGLGVVREQAAGWQRAVTGLVGLEQLTEHALPGALTADLRHYQQEGFNWLATLWELGLGGILADDMGLGKTLQALALICHVRESRSRAGAPACPFLVVAPTSVVPNWAAEAARFAPELDVRPVYDTLARGGRGLHEVACGADVVVTTYTLLRIDAERYGELDWEGLILDEAQAVKNPNAKTHAVVRGLTAPFKLAITGTPFENNLMELWSLLSITAPGLFPTPVAFKEHYAVPIERRDDATRLELLRRRTRPLLKRRTKELVASELPPKQEQILEVELHPRHRKLYDTHLQRERQRILGLLEDFDKNRFSVLTAITHLRQLSLHPGLVDETHRKVPAAKLEALSEQLADVVGGGHRALVFSQFTGFLGLVRERLDADGIAYCYLDGRTRRRSVVINSFKEGTAPVFLISLKAGGFGLNLTEADYCFLMDPWWNPATESQAIDRTHRIGQTRQVMVYRLVSKHTIEEKVVDLAHRKAKLFSSVLDDGDLFSASISAEDIRGLLD